jgi:hypothetical protein
LVQTNPACTRLGPLPSELFELIGQQGFALQDWNSARNALGKTGLTKYADFNLLNLVDDNPSKPTFEVRILPGSTSPIQIARQAVLFEAILNWCVAHPVGLTAGDKKIPDFGKFLSLLDMDEKTKNHWLAKL